MIWVKPSDIKASHLLLMRAVHHTAPAHVTAQMQLEQQFVEAGLGRLLPSVRLHGSAWTVSLTAPTLYVVQADAATAHRHYLTVKSTPACASHCCWVGCSVPVLLHMDPSFSNWPPTAAFKGFQYTAGAGGVECQVPGSLTHRLVLPRHCLYAEPAQRCPGAVTDLYLMYLTAAESPPPFFPRPLVSMALHMPCTCSAYRVGAQRPCRGCLWVHWWHGMVSHDVCR